MLNKIILLFFVTSTLSARELYCTKQGRIKVIKFNKPLIESASYCSNSSYTKLFSYNCKDLNYIAQNMKFDNVKKESLFSEIGKPGFKLCRQVNGNPQIIEFLAKEKWYKLDRCTFDIDGSFIDTSSLMRNYLDSQKKNP